MSRKSKSKANAASQTAPQVAAELTDKPGRKNEFHERMLAQLGETEAAEFFASLDSMVKNRDSRRSLRLNSLRNTTDSVLEGLGIKILGAVPWVPTKGRFFEATDTDLSLHPASGAALFYMQEAGAMEPVAMLEPQPGELILDLCAAPGGKSTQILEEMQGQGWLVVNEPVSKRAERLDALIARHGALNVSVYSLNPEALCARFGPIFDRVLVDAPCSGESLFAKRQDIRRDVRDVDVRGCARRQFTILTQAAESVKPGGIIVYSTCTYSREENEVIVQGFLDANPSFELIEERRRWPHRDGVPGGYAAKIRRSEDATSGSMPSFLKWKDGHGLIRHGYWRWNNEVDLYAIAQNFKSDLNYLRHPNGEMREALADHLKALPAEIPTVDLAIDAAKKVLRGESVNAEEGRLFPRGFCRLTWQGYPIGCGKAVETRINNLIPRLLRTSGEF